MFLTNAFPTNKSTILFLLDESGLFKSILDEPNDIVVYKEKVAFAITYFFTREKHTIDIRNFYI